MLYKIVIIIVIKNLKIIIKLKKEKTVMKKFVCSVCGYVYEGEAAPEKCPVCGVGADKFVEQKEDEMSWAAEHVVGVAKRRKRRYLSRLKSKL